MSKIDKYRDNIEIVSSWVPGAGEKRELRLAATLYGFLFGVREMVWSWIVGMVIHCEYTKTTE